MSAPNAEFTAQVAAAVLVERAAKAEDLGREATLWLAAVPLWTRSAAETAGFPVPSVVEFVKRARDAGWCETRGSLRAHGAAELRFWMPDEVRRDVLDLLSQGWGRERMLEEAEGIAERILRLPRTAGIGARQGETALPGALWDWAELMREAGPDVALVDRVGQAVEAPDLSGAQQLVSAGEALAALLAGTMELAVDRARRLLSLGMRRRQDSRALERYLDRPELSGAVTRLLQADAAQWALHLRGVGGTGKTMLIRYLASGRYAADRDVAAIPIARVDFDHMSPDYPVRRPVQMLLELADELKLHTAAVSQADRALALFHAIATSVHESLSSVREEHPSPMQNPQVLEAIDAFADVIRRLPGVLLILDTCEELAKADSGDPAAPAVRTTLAIIERIHDSAPSVRVLFAGRRPLPRRPYLGVREVTGFTVDEARSYLTAFSGRPLPDELADAMIRQSPAMDAAVPPPGELPERVSPFDLALYRSWAAEDPGLDVRRVEQGSYAYIEGRIIERLHDPGVLRALPVLACAGRWRVATIASFLAADAAVLGPRLAEQEWVDADGDPPAHVSAKPALARRLHHYFSAPDRAAGFTAETARLALALHRQVRDAPLAEVDVDELLAALRLSEPADAAKLWDDLAERAAAAGRWNWMLNVTRRVLGESEEEQWPTADALRATVLASYIAASRRAIASFNARAAWAGVLASHGSHPDEENSWFLLARAALGSLPYAPDDESLWEALRAAVVPFEYRDPTRAAELTLAPVDTVHRLLEVDAGEAARRIVAEGFLDPILAVGPTMRLDKRALPDRARAQARAWALVALARLHADDDPPAALNALIRAENEAGKAAATESDAPSAWFDWIPPEDLLARVRIEHGLIAPPDDDILATWESYARDNLGGIDGERLASLCLRLRLGKGVIEPSVIERWEEADRYEPDRVATCSAHDLVPPLCATLAEAWLAAGNPRRALDIVERRRAAALDTRDDDATVRIADAETVRIARRLRLDDQRALLSRLSAISDPDPSRLDLVDSARRAMAVVYGEPPRRVGDEILNRPAGWHAWWQCQSNPQRTLPPAEWSSNSPGAELAADIELDLEELRQLKHPELPQLETELAGWLARPRPAPRVRSAGPYRGVRAGLRRAALAAERYERPPEVPQRLLAEMAFDEAELLTPRLASAAARLFGYAYDAYSASGDCIGQVLAAASIAAIDEALLEPPVMQASLARLRADRPDVAAALNGPAGEAGPWSYWAAFLQQQVPASEWFAPTFWKRSRDIGALLLDSVFQAFSTLSGIGGLIALGLAVAKYVPSRLLIVLASLIVALLVVAVTATGAWRLRSVLRLADSTAVGTFFRPASLGFSALIAPTPRGRPVFLWAHLRPLHTVPIREWPRLLTIALAVWLVLPFRQSSWTGYKGWLQTMPSQAAQLTWEAEHPAADSQWWSGRTAAGVIFVNPADATQPWERIISASLGPQAAGRIEWYRRLFVFARRATEHDSTRVALDAPAEWLRFFRPIYDSGGAEPEAAQSLVQVRHAIGRAVSTSAGPRLDVSGESAEARSARDLLGTEILSRGSPSAIVLQAEPTSEAVDAGLRDDLPEKLALAVDLIQAGAAPAVLILPTLPASLATGVARAIAAHAASRRARDTRALLAELRGILRGALEPAMLDDLVLFVNARG